jgi:hypothetical protein
MGCVHARFSFVTAPELEDLVSRLRQDTGLNLAVVFAAHNPRRGFPYDRSACITLPTGESVDLMRSSDVVGVEFVPAGWRQDYLSQAALYLLLQAGGQAKHKLSPPKWAARRWVDVPKIHLFLRSAAYYALLAVWLPLAIPIAIATQIVARLRRV